MHACGAQSLKSEEFVFKIKFADSVCSKCNPVQRTDNTDVPYFISFFRENPVSQFGWADFPEAGRWRRYTYKTLLVKYLARNLP